MKKAEEDGEEGDEGEGGWDVEDDLELPEDLGATGLAVAGEEGYFVPPTKGNPPSQASSICSSQCHV